jgi:prepilin-type N-terminal cleavage/methylation domain-containing protein
MRQEVNIQRNHGFTLIELIVTMLILGILAVIASAKYLDLAGLAKAESTKAAVGAIRSVVIMQYAQNLTQGTQTYPASISNSNFADNLIPINKCNGQRAIAVVSSAPAGTTEDGTNGFWYMTSNGQVGAYASAAIAQCSNTSSF